MSCLSCTRDFRIFYKISHACTWIKLYFFFSVCIGYTGRTSGHWIRHCPYLFIECQQCLHMYIECMRTTHQCIDGRFMRCHSSGELTSDSRTIQLLSVPSFYFVFNKTLHGMTGGQGQGWAGGGGEGTRECGAKCIFPNRISQKKNRYDI